MTTVPPSTRSTTYTLASASSGPFLVGFRLFDATLAVYVNGLPRVDFAVTAIFSGGYTDSASISFSTALAIGDEVRIDGDMPIARGTTYLNPDPSLTKQLNIEFGRVWSALQQLERDVGSSTSDEINVRAFTQGAAGQRFEISKDASPANFDTTTAGFVYQWRDNNNGVAANLGTIRTSAICWFKDEVQGTTSSPSASGVITSHGWKAFVNKTYDGSSHSFTATGELDQNGVDKGFPGANGYNEYGAFQTSASNIGSSNGYMSGLEVHFRDAPDNVGATSYATRMTGAAIGLKKFNNSVLRSDNIHVLNEATGVNAKDLNAILYATVADTAATWQIGIDFYSTGNWTFNTLKALRMKDGMKIVWEDGTNTSEVYANATANIVLQPGAAGAAVLLGNDGSVGVPSLAFAADPDTGIYRQNPNVFGLVAGGVERVRILNNNIQIAIGAGALKTVTEGVADSGGVGFKLLRVPN